MLWRKYKEWSVDIIPKYRIGLSSDDAWPLHHRSWWNAIRPRVTSLGCSSNTVVSWGKWLLPKVLPLFDIYFETTSHLERSSGRLSKHTDGNPVRVKLHSNFSYSQSSISVLSRDAHSGKPHLLTGNPTSTTLSAQISIIHGPNLLFRVRSSRLRIRTAKGTWQHQRRTSLSLVLKFWYL